MEKKGQQASNREETNRAQAGRHGQGQEHKTEGRVEVQPGTGASNRAGGGRFNRGGSNTGTAPAAEKIK